MASLLDAPMDEWTLVHALDRQVAAQGNRTFLTFEDGSELTFAGLGERSDRFATALARFGVGPGDRVLALAKNHGQFLVAMLATHKRRAVFVPVNTELKGAFLEHQLRNSEPEVIVVDADLAPLFDAVDTTGVPLRRVVFVGPPPAELPSALADTAIDEFDTLVDATRADPGAALTPQPNDVCTIMYTSGTTGPSKGVLMPQAHCYQFAAGIPRLLDMTAGDHFYVCMPFFHANALFMQIFSCLMTATPATVRGRFSPNAWLDDVIACGATITNTLGVMPEFIATTAPTDRDRDHRLRAVFAVPIADEWGTAFEQRFGVRFFQGYGMTEVNMVCYSDLDDPLMSGCAGRVLDDFFEVRVVDPETDRELPIGEIGEIVVRPSQPNVFNAGYFRMEEKTVEAWRNLWFHTGDAGRFDDEGRLFFEDRINDRLRRRGENISSYEVEQVLNAHASVAESAVVGVRAEVGGEEEVKAYIVADAEAPDPGELIEFCREHMPRFAIPRFIEFVPELDMTPSGKVRKQALRDLGVTPATWDREA